MFAMDVPSMPVQQTPIVLTQAASTGTDSTLQPDYILKMCKETENGGDPRSAMRAVDPAGMLYIYFRRHGRDINLASIKTTLLEGTTHGKISSVVDNTGRPWYRYDAEPNYVGKDKAVFMAEFEGKRYKIVLDLHVFTIVNENSSTCPPPQLIKVKKPASGSSGLDLNTIPVTFAALAKGAIGQTDASGITLNTNASGYNWFVDSTPADNSEYLPTSTPNEWIAKAGSEAAGKMDMLSVLLHEYGHALGIEHSPDSSDYMATTLQPGVRRLPSTGELARMAQLVGEAVGRVSTRQVGMNSDLPNTPINPGLPIGTTLNALLLGRLRRTDYGSWSPMFDSVQFPAPAPQFEIAVHPKLQNPDFDGQACLPLYFQPHELVRDPL